MAIGILIGVLAALVVVFVVIIRILVKVNKKKAKQFVHINKRLAEIFQWVKDRPQTIIHLDLNGVDLDTKLGKIQPSIIPSNFVVKAEGLSKILIAKYNEKSKDISRGEASVQIAVLCVIDETGLGDIIGYESRKEITRVLTILFINANGETANVFLKTLAESVCQAMAALPEKTEEPVS